MQLYNSKTHSYLFIFFLLDYYVVGEWFYFFDYRTLNWFLSVPEKGHIQHESLKFLKVNFHKQDNNQFMIICHISVSLQQPLSRSIVFYRIWPLFSKLFLSQDYFFQLKK